MTDGPRYSPEHVEAMKRMFGEGRVRIPRDSDVLRDLERSDDFLLSRVYAAIARHEQQRGKVQLAMEALDALHGPNPENRTRRRRERAEADIRDRLTPKDDYGNAPFTLRILTEDGEVLWTTGRPEAALYMPVMQHDFAQLDAELCRCGGPRVDPPDACPTCFELGIR